MKTRLYQGKVTGGEQRGEIVSLAMIEVHLGGAGIKYLSS